MDFFKASDVEKFQYIPIPKVFFTKRYEGLSWVAKCLWGVLWDRVGLSLKNNWITADGYVYILYSQNNLAEMMGCSKRTIIRAMRDLEQQGLVSRIKQGLSKPDYIFVAIPPSDHDEITHDPSDKMSPVVVTKCHPSGDKMSPVLVTKCHPSLPDIVNLTELNTISDFSSDKKGDNDKPKRITPEYIMSRPKFKETFELLWQFYPRKANKMQAKRTLAKIAKDRIKMKMSWSAFCDRIADRIEDYIAKIQEDGTEERYIQHFSTFLNAHDWDEPTWQEKEREAIKARNLERRKAREASECEDSGSCEGTVQVGVEPDTAGTWREETSP